MPSGIKRLLGLSPFSHGIPFAGPVSTPTPSSGVSWWEQGKHFLWLLLLSRCPDGPPGQARLLLLDRVSLSTEEEGSPLPPPAAGGGGGVLGKVSLGHFLLLGGDYKTPLIVVPSFWVPKSFHLLFPPFRIPLHLGPSLVPVLTVVLSRE